MKLHHVLATVATLTCVSYLGNALADMRCRTTPSGLTYCLDNNDSLTSYKRWRDSGPLIKEKRESSNTLGYRRWRGKKDILIRKRPENFGYFRHRD